MKIYLINIERASDRRQYMLGELSRLLPGVAIERAMCVDIKSDGWKAPTWVRAGRWKSDRWSLGPSDIEIFRSHMDCWEKISASREPGLVFEDDLLFAEQLATAVEVLTACAVEGLVRLDGVPGPILLGPQQPLSSGFSLARVKTIVASAGAYFVDPKTASGLAEVAQVNRTVDDFLFDPTPSDRGTSGHAAPIFQLEPAVAVQAQFGSFADERRVIPDFLLATKRADTGKRRDRRYTGPLAYRVRKELLRSVYRRRLKSRIAETLAAGGRWSSPVMSADLRLDQNDR